MINKNILHGVVTLVPGQYPGHLPGAMSQRADRDVLPHTDQTGDQLGISSPWLPIHHGLHQHHHTQVSAAMKALLS